MSSPDGAYANAAGVLKFLRIESFYWHQMASVFLISHVKPIDLCLKKILIFGSESVIHDVCFHFFGSEGPLKASNDLRREKHVEAM